MSTTPEELALLWGTFIVGRWAEVIADDTEPADDWQEQAAAEAVALFRPALDEMLDEAIDARLAPIRALAKEWERFANSCADELAALLSAPQDHAWHEPLRHCHCRRVIPCRHHGLSAPLTAPAATAGPPGHRDGDGLREAAAWVAAIGYPVDLGSSVRMPDALWEALVDHVHADQTGDWHGNTLDREETASWLAEEAGR